MRRSLLSLAVASILLGGCSLIPDYQRPASPVDSLWPSEAGGAQTATAAADLDWRAFFKDPALQGLIDTALANNRDLRVAALNVEAYAAQRQIQRSALFPSVTADGGATRQRLPGSLSSSGEPSISSQYSATLGASWELDLFGRLRSLDEQALQQYFATEEARRATQIALVASVANAWLTLQADQELLQLTQDTLKTYQQSFALTQRSYDVGVADALALAQARSAVESAQVSLAQYSRQVAQDRNALVVLLGSGKAGGLPAGQPLDDDLLLEVPAGLPSDLLQRRPDLRQAEHQLQAANANIGAARAAFFPSVSLTANAGSLSPDLAGLFDAGSGSWLFQPSISLPIFNAGKLRASLDYAELQKDIQVASYEKAIQTAFQEVADGLAARATYQQQLEAQRALVKTNEEYYRLAERRYRTGVDSYLTLLDAQRQLFSVRQQLIGDRLAQLTSEVELYKALGGGWSEPSQLASAPAQD
ncbi:AdeC/AdeK/OprM family multidrug efflux complex outer membrane factor [Aquipseudomonas alcaligenes]|uniref:Outer membrane protein OprM n=1 Tax=Aquipseudomonas alcaligenes TaxID=43263 RepID=A0AA37CH66_AQUAC|nr:AdeC/AdeK/OprM family multidrug efflux complex outer membrane factor [Pseudomonas alcaligenes]BCR23271.1 outer membrane protein OprM [Pseudomonas alcaligenes]GIZ67690.1 outer membrane protein OprM [Pseudomonas alcaligenes]GIZ71997.1 outer membrane protein OprM [Pseudomonas alcaligenes]GIZ76346.1 outer membrane protein OprM [Pseudomonas alcaligenes]GIZ80420.1 outer membrane protein OprM [Pseudomonas alcaligenes]